MSSDHHTARGQVSRTILLATALAAERRRGPGLLAMLLFWACLAGMLYLKYGR